MLIVPLTGTLGQASAAWRQMLVMQFSQMQQLQEAYKIP